MISFHSRKKAYEVVQGVAKVFGTTPELIYVRRHEWESSRPRGVAMYVLNRCFGWSYPFIGKAMTGYHHTTVMYHIRRVDRTMQQDDEYRERVQRLIAHFRVGEIKA